MTPSLLSTMLHRGGETNEEISNGLRHLRALVVMGEVLTTSLLVLCTNLLPGCKVINSLSISECHDITFVELYSNQSGPMEPGGSFANCGPPLNNVTIQVRYWPTHVLFPFSFWSKCVCWVYNSQYYCRL